MAHLQPVQCVPALRAIVEATLDAKIFYEDEFKRACRPTWDTANPAIENRLPDVVQDEAMSPLAQREEVQRIKALLAEGGRGAWAVVRRRAAAGNERYLSLIHDGRGEVHGRSDGWGGVPTFEAVVDRLVAEEIYHLRHVVEDERRRAAAVQQLATLNLAVGTRLKDVRVGGTVYSTAAVEVLHPLSGSVTLQLTKRGSRKRYRATVSATTLAGDPNARRVDPTILVNAVVAKHAA
ncbi:MAG: hypothetical protein ACREPQ_14150 [Rhodanobacter sp.]